MTLITTDREIDITALPWPAVQRWDGTTAEIEVPDDVPAADLTAAVQSAPPAPDRAAELANRIAISEAARDHITDLRAIASSSGTLTNAQLSNAMRVLARGQIRLIRLTVGMFDGTA